MFPVRERRATPPRTWDVFKPVSPTLVYHLPEIFGKLRYVRPLQEYGMLQPDPETSNLYGVLTANWLTVTAPPSAWVA